MSKPIIEVRNLSKKYILGERQPYYSLRDTLSSLATLPFKKDKLQRDEFWALKDVSFDINEGDVVGVIGRNGAGKSTLLKILSQITLPTKGEIKLRGRVASLLEVGTGFHPELTGRENVYLNGAILGMKRWEINKKFNEIVEFAEIEKFLDTPVKHYSSGMYMRLAFSVAAHLEPEILLVDEVLAVGDAQFQKKCLGKMSEVSKQGRTVLLVSHNISIISSLCRRCLYLRDGSIAGQGLSEKIVDIYTIDGKKNQQEILENRRDRTGDGDIKIKDLIINEGKEVISGEKISITLQFINKENISSNCRVSIAFKDLIGNFLFICSTEMYFKHQIDIRDKITCNIEKLPLTEGEYYCDIFIERNKIIQDWIREAKYFKVEPGFFNKGARQVTLGYEGKGVLVEHNWKIT